MRPDSTKDAKTVSGMFNELSSRYDLTNAVMSFGLHRGWRRQVVRALRPRKGMRVLDIAAGTGTSSVPIAATGAHVVAADFSPGMLAVGQERYRGIHNLEFCEADATELPFADDSFDATTCSFGLRNVQDPQRALAELFRVTKPGGTIVLCEFSHPPVAAVRVGYFWYLRRVLPWIAGLLTGSRDSYEYFGESIEGWPKQQVLASWLGAAGFVGVQYRNVTAGTVAIHRGRVPAVPANGDALSTGVAAARPASAVTADG